jgi:Flp pilus assembly pilin Flp
MSTMTMNYLYRMWREDDGVLSFEWTLLVTLLTIGIVAGLAGARDAIIDELGDLAAAAQGIDQSYSLAGFEIPDLFTVPSMSFAETAADKAFSDCGRASGPVGQP